MSHTSHIPKLVAPHGLFLRTADAPVIGLKPGQTQAERQGLYTTERKDAKDTYLKDNQVNKTSYNIDISSVTKVKDYLSPRKPIIPAALLKQKEGVKRGEGYTASIWQSTSKAAYDSEKQGLNEACLNYKRMRGPPQSFVEPPTCVSEPIVTTTNAVDFGVFGSQPMDKMKADPTRLPRERTELTKGTTQGTCHIPGYHGFLPTNTANPSCAKFEKGEHVRPDKHQIGDQFHLNPPGYSGHIPVSAINDQGARQVTKMTTFGRDFASNAGFA